MAKRLLKETPEEELLRLAGGRVVLPPGDLLLKYQSDVDMLAVILDPATPSTHSEDDQRRGLIFNFAGKKLVSIEVLDLYGTFVS
ncbi:MAG: hypothetical protein ABR577_17120 [Pyrinomonadaceae bacterium]